jgi:putative ABC transport system ATP-binding protein
MSNFILEATRISKTLGEGAGRVQALNDITLSLSDGELTMLMGPSGSGKTTLLSILGCMLAPTSGKVRICGKPVPSSDREEMTRMRRDYIGFVFQTYHLFPTMSATENVQLALDVRGVRGRDAHERSVTSLAKVGLGGKIESYPLQLSGGEQQRVAIARALVSEPSIILADEPTAALDTVNGKALMGILREIGKEPGRSVLVVTHDTRLTPFADRILLIEDGRLVGEERGQAQGEGG